MLLSLIVGNAKALAASPFEQILAIGDVPEAFSAGNLPDQHGQELTPTLVCAEFFSRMMAFGKRVKFISRDKYNELLPYCIAIDHGSDIIGLLSFLPKPLCNQRVLRAIFLQFL